MGASWEKVTFGKTGLRVSPIGLGSSYGVGAKDLARAHDKGINFFFWGLRRRGDFGLGVRRLAKKDREGIVIAAQSYTRMASLMGPSLDRVLRYLQVDHVDLLGLGWWNDLPPQRIMDAAYRLVEAGKVKHLLISSHNRPSFLPMMEQLRVSSIMVRYNAAHTGAEREVFPYLAGHDHGVLSFTATRWGTLLKPRFLPQDEPAPRGSDCYRFVLTSPHVHATLAGPRDGEELDEAMAALDRGPMTEDELAWMRRVGKSVHAAVNGNPVIGFFDRVRGMIFPNPQLPPAAAARGSAAPGAAAATEEGHGAH